MPSLFQKPIACELSPNTTSKDVGFALRHLLNPLSWFSWTRGTAVQELEDYFKNRFHVSFAKSFDNGRSALQLVLEALGIQDGDEILIQSFTCVVVPNSIIAASAVPVYVDIDDTYNMDPNDLEEQIQQCSKPTAVIVQHTFGQPAQMDRIIEICKTNNVLLIEDCAHSIGARYKDKEIGTFGDAAMFSFGRDKAISTVSGGMAIVHHPEYGQQLNRLWKSAKYPSLIWIKQRLLHIIIFAIAKRLYYTLSLGKILIAISRQLHCIPLVLSSKEKTGTQEKYRRFPNVLAKLALLQLSQLDDYNQHRIQLSDIYTKALSALPNVTLPRIATDTTPYLLRYTIELNESSALLQYMKQRGVLLGNWYRTVIAPSDSDQRSVGYSPGMCEKAEAVTSTVVNLPTNIQTSVKDAKHLVSLVQQYHERH